MPYFSILEVFVYVQWYEIFAFRICSDRVHICGFAMHGLIFHMSQEPTYTNICSVNIMLACCFECCCVFCYFLFVILFVFFLCIGSYLYFPCYKNGGSCFFSYSDIFAF